MILHSDYHDSKRTEPHSENMEVINLSCDSLTDLLELLSIARSNIEKTFSKQQRSLNCISVQVILSTTLDTKRRTLKWISYF